MKKIYTQKNFLYGLVMLFSTALFAQNGSDVQLTLDTDYVIKYGTETISGSILNNSTQTISSATINWQVDNGTVYSQNFNQLNLATGASMNFSHANKWVATPGNYTIKAWVSNINGVTSSDPYTLDIAVAGDVAQMQPLFEKFTSSTCPPCVPFNIVFNNFLAQPDVEGKFTYLNYQMNWPGAGDPYYTAEGGVRRNLYAINGVPSVVFQGAFIGNAPPIGALNNHLNNSPYGYGTDAFFEIDGTFDIDGDNIMVDLSIMPLMDAEYRVHVVVVENLTTGNVGTNGETEFKRVMMKMIPDAQGTLVNFVTGEAYEESHTVDLSTTNVEEMDDLDVIIFVQNPADKRIMQARSINNPPLVTIDEFNFATFNMYPNPSEGIFNISTQNTLNLEVYDITGKLVYTQSQVQNDSRIDLSFLNSGMYIAKVMDNNNSHSQKIVIK